MNHVLDDLITEVLECYFEDAQWRVEAKESGVNNTTRFVYTPMGTFVLRIYDNHEDLNKIIYENTVLQQLQRVKLPYRVPKPLTTLKGNTYVVTVSGKIAVVFEYIEGERANMADTQHVAAIGRAMGELTDALSQMQLDVDAAYEPYYELYEVHPLVTKERLDAWMRDMIDGPFQNEIQLLSGGIDRLLNDIPALCRLPAQLTHSDIVAGNVLVLGDEISGVLDFEFVTPDLRAMDAAVFLCELIRHEEENSWSLVESFISGYGQAARLNEDEIDALPQLILLRSMVLCIHFLGRYWDGIDEEQDVTRYLMELSQVYAWLEQNQERLQELCKQQWG
ncbi:phosphotransferase [Paenibacillus sp. UNC451MF]|uniref:phosphotransferase n=1 Tax=Paenibacillus sp. UNC451MF TaxID=1449063 RepID=UPI00048DF2D6|nr:phosphotransferase [Paenibacillus sp. UNC451MF]